MTRKLTLTLASALALSVVAGAAIAQPQGPGPRGNLFEMLDTNKDGVLSAAEINAKRLERHKALDPNGDGVITLEEMKAEAGERAKQRAEAMAEARFKALDIDGDGRLSAAEAMEGGGFGGPRDMARHILRADADGNGEVTKEEFEKAMKRHDRADRPGRGERHDRAEREGRRDHHERRPGHERPNAPEGKPPAPPAPAQN